MKFLRIEMLFLIWAVPVFLLVFIYGMKKRRKILLQFSSVKGLQAIAPGAFSNRRRTKALLILCVLLFLALALSGLQYGYKWQEVERKGIDIMVALDCSRSMLAADIKPTRLDRAKREIYDLLNMLAGDRVGLVAFSGTAFLQCPLTLDYEAFHIFLKNLTPDYLPVGGTNLTDAIVVSLDGFDETSRSEKAVILITDGENTGEGYPIEAAETAKKKGVKLFCIGVGSEDGVPVPHKDGGLKKDKSGNIVLTKLDEDTLKKIAILTGGTYVRSVAGDMDLDAIYTNEIREKMETSTLQSSKKQIWEDRYQWFLGLAILALIAELFLPAYRQEHKQLSKSVSIVLFALLVLFNPVAYAAGSAQEGLKAYDAGDYEKALKLFIDAQLEKPDKPEILYNVGNAYYKTGNFESACKNFAQVLKTENKDLKQKAFYNLGNTEYRKGNFEEAVKNYNEALKLNPNDEWAKQNIEFVKKVIEQKKQQDENKDPEDQKEEQEDKQENEQYGDKDQESQEESEQKDKTSGDEYEQDDGQKDETTSGDDEGQKDEISEKDDAEKDEASPKYGDEMKDEQQTDSPEENSASPNDEENKENEDENKTGTARAKPSENPGESDEKKQAERILNRLKDEPGRAMIPSYGKRRIEKDW